MALLGNYTPLSNTPGRVYGIGFATSRSSWSTNGARANRFTNSDFDKGAAIPSGYRAPYMWSWALVTGALAARNTVIAGGTISASGAMGVNGSAVLAGSGTVGGAAQLIVSAVAALVGSGSITNAAAVAFLNAAATLAGSGDLAGSAVAIGHAAGAISGSGTLVAEQSATGKLVADLTPFTELSPQSLAASVWSSPEGKFLYAVAHHKTVTDPVAGTFTVYDQDGTTVLYVADLWQNVAGTVGYQGQGADRRDSF